MKNTLLFLLPFSLLIAQNSGLAGEKVGNGGTVYDCDDGKAYLVDLREPELRRGLRDFVHVEESTASVDEQIAAAFKRISDLSPSAGAEALSEWKFFRESIEWREGKYNWDVTADVGAVPIPEGCRLANAVMYYSDREIDGQNEIRKRMSRTHQAALEVHEVLYKIMRKRGSAENAVAARRLTAQLFSNLAQDSELLISMISRLLVLNFHERPRVTLLPTNRMPVTSDMSVRTQVFNSGIFYTHYKLNCPRLPDEKATLTGCSFYGDRILTNFPNLEQPNRVLNFVISVIRVLNLNPRAKLRKQRVVELYEQNFGPNFRIDARWYLFADPRLDTYLTGDLRTVTQ